MVSKLLWWLVNYFPAIFAEHHLFAHVHLDLRQITDLNEIIEFLIPIMDRRIKENLANCYRFARSLVGVSSLVVNGKNEPDNLNPSWVITFDKLVCRPQGQFVNLMQLGKGYVHLMDLESFFFELNF